MKKILLGVLLGVLFLLGGCTSTQPKLSQMQIREITTKELEGDYKTVFKATMTILQDQNYIIDNADIDTGLISCEKAVEKETTTGDVLMILFVDARHGASSKVNVSATFTEISKKVTRVRLNIQETVITKSSFGNNENSVFITDKGIYDSLFNQIMVETERLKALK